MNIAIFHGGGSKFHLPLKRHWENLGHSVRDCPNYSIYQDWEPSLIFFEWMNNNTASYTRKWINLIPEDKRPRVVVREHGVGVRAGIYRQVDFTKVNELIFVSDWLRRQCDDRIDITNVHVVRNGIDLDRFTLKRSFEPTYKVAFIGRPTEDKGFDKLPEIMARFKALDLRYTLHCALGQIEDINEWLEDKDYLVHPSLMESFCYAVGEAMAKGVHPLINHWEGAEETWGDKFFLDDFNLTGERWLLRKFIEDNYNQKKMVAEITNICGITQKE